MCFKSSLLHLIIYIIIIIVMIEPNMGKKQFHSVVYLVYPFSVIAVDDS